MLLTKHIKTKFFELVAQAAYELQMPTFVIGGYVRDILLDRKSKDIDIVVLGSGIELAQVVASKLPGKKEVKFYGQFGTAMIRYRGIEIEFVGARKESYTKNSRKPIVENGTLIDDQNRRDFTINAMAISLQKENFGELIDPFDGVSDLKNKIIRTPLCPDITYSDDPLRMMRAIRFATQLNFTIENKSFKAIKRNKKRIKIVSMERITDELNKIIAVPKPSIGFKLLFDSGLLEIIFPQITDLQGVDVVNGKGHKDNFYHTLEVLDNLATHSDDLWLRWAAILHDIAKPQTKRFEENHGWTFHSHEFRGAKMIPGIFKMLRLPLNDKMKFVQKMVLLHLRPIVLAQEEITDSAVRRLLFDAGEDIDALMLLCDADVTSKNEYKVQKYRENFQLVRRKLKEIAEKDNFRNWQPPINGEMIMQAFDIQQGHEVGIIKHAIREAILDGMIENNFEDAYRFMKKIGEEELQLTIKNEIQKPIEISNTPVPSKNT